MDKQILFSLLEERNIRELRPLLIAMNPADLAVLLEEVKDEELPIVFRLLPKDLAAETFVEMDSKTQKLLIASFSDIELKVIIDELFIDDMVDIIEEMPANVVKRILNQSDATSRKVINEILQYPKDSAGSIMTIEYLTLRKNMTVEQALQRIRKIGFDKETIYTCYVTDEQRHLLGIVTVKDMLLSANGVLLDDIMQKNIISVNTQTDKEVVANKFRKYGFLAIPVADMENRLVGIITIDDAMDVIEKEATEDITKMSGVIHTDKPYLKKSTVRIFLDRVPWLLILMISATFTGMIITKYEHALAISITLTACIPMLMDTGGNAGSQACVTVIRGVALNEISFKDLFVVLWKEIRVSALLSLVLGIACFAKLMIIDKLFRVPYGFMITLTVCLSLCATVIIAKVVGSILPLFAKKLKLDPAVVASPIITTIVDAFSLIIYCNIAIAILTPLGAL